MIPGSEAGGFRPARTAEGAIAYVRSLLSEEVWPVGIVAQCDADDGSTWWDIRCRFAFPRERRPAWAEGMPVSIEGDEGEVELLVAESPGHILYWDEPEFRGPATALTEEIARAFGVRSFVRRF